MKLSEVKNILRTAEAVNFVLENGDEVPAHFHVTEVGIVTKHFIDCGGTVRKERVANFQLWDANDFDHRLKPEKLSKIITLSEELLGMEDLEIEVEYQQTTISKYALGFDGRRFVLLSKTTDCLAPEKCGIPQEKLKVNLRQIPVNNACTPGACTPGGGCC
jgi:hypothetical protein